MLRHLTSKEAVSDAMRHDVFDRIFPIPVRRVGNGILRRETPRRNARCIVNQALEKIRCYKAYEKDDLLSRSLEQVLADALLFEGAN